MDFRHSALTDFLAVCPICACLLVLDANLSKSHNISATQIRQDANARRAAALASQQAGSDDDEDDEEDDDDDEGTSSPRLDLESLSARRKKETKAQSAKRKKDEEVNHLSEYGIGLITNIK